MAERKKVQKINLRQKPKNSAAGRAKPKAAAAKPAQPKAPSQSARFKEPTRQVRSTPEQIPMEQKSVSSAHTAPKKQSPRTNTVRGTIVPRSTSGTARSKAQKQTPSADRKRSVPSQEGLHPVKQKPAAGPHLSVVLGNKLKARRKRLITYAAMIAVIGVIVAFCVSSPTGPFERITNSFAVVGGGDYPAAISGTGVKAFKQTNGKSFVLSNSHLTGYTTAGKEFLSIQHNFSNPVLEVSRERALVYNRESNGFLITNNSDILYEQSLEFPIYTADIADNGSLAFATKSSGYAAQVQVFARGMKQKFTWYLVDGLISDVTLSDNGKYLAVSVLKVSNGSFSSEVLCFDISKDEPLFTLEEAGTPVVSVETVSSKRFAYLSNDKLVFVDWKSGAKTDADGNGRSPSFFRVGDEMTYAVFGEAARSLVVAYNEKGNLSKQAEINGLIDNITVSKEYIYVLRGNQILVFDWQANELGSIALEQKPVCISAMKKHVFSVDNLSLQKHRFLEEKNPSSEKET